MVGKPVERLACIWSNAGFCARSSVGGFNLRTHVETSKICSPKSTKVHGRPECITYTLTPLEMQPLGMNWWSDDDNQRRRWLRRWRTRKIQACSALLGWRNCWAQQVLVWVSIRISYLSLTQPILVCYVDMCAVLWCQNQWRIYWCHWAMPFFGPPKFLAMGKNWKTWFASPCVNISGQRKFAPPPLMKALIRHWSKWRPESLFERLGICIIKTDELMNVQSNMRDDVMQIVYKIKSLIMDFFRRTNAYNFALSKNEKNTSDFIIIIYH